MIVSVKEYVFKEVICVNPQGKWEKKFYPLLRYFKLTKKYDPMHRYDIRIVPETDEMFEYLSSSDVVACMKGITFLVIAKFESSKSILISNTHAIRDIDLYMPLKKLVLVARAHSESQSAHKSLFSKGVFNEGWN